MNDTVLSDEVLREVEARRVVDHHLESGVYIGCYILLSTSERDTLCATVRVLRELAYVPKILADDDEITYRDQTERLLRETTALREQLAQCTIELERESREMQKWNNRANQLAIEGQDLRRQLAQAESLAETRSDLIAAKAAHVDKLQSQLAQVTAERDRYACALESATKGIKCDD